MMAGLLKTPAYKVHAVFAAAFATVFFAHASPSVASVSQTRHPTVIHHQNTGRAPLRIVEKRDDVSWDHVCQANLSDYDYNDYVIFEDFQHQLSSNPPSNKINLSLQWDFENYSAPGVPPTGIRIGIWNSQTGQFEFVTDSAVTIADAQAGYTIVANIPNIIQTAAQANSVKVAFYCYTNTDDNVTIRMDQLQFQANSTKVPRFASSTNNRPLQLSDDIWFAAFNLKSNQNAYLIDDYMEFAEFAFSFPTGSTIGNGTSGVTVTAEVHTNRDQLDEMELAIWDDSASAWVERVLSPPQTYDVVDNIDIATFVNTPAELAQNTFLIRLLARENSASNFFISADNLVVKAKRAILAQDIDIFGPAAGTVNPGQADALLFDFRIPDDNGTADVLTALKLTNQGTLADSNIGNVRLYADAGATGWGGVGAETLVGTMTYNSGQSRWEISGLNRTLSVGGARFFAAADINSSSPEGSGIRMAVPVLGVTVTSGYHGPTDQAASNPSLLTIAGATLAITGANQAPVQVNLGQTGVSMEKITFTVSLGSATIDSIKVDRSGSSADSDVDANGVRIFWDDDGNGTYDGTEPQLSTSKTFSAGSVTFTGANLTVGSGSPKSAFVVYDIAAGATGGNTVGVSIPNATYIATVSGSETKTMPAALQSTNSIISSALIVSSTDIAPTTASVGQTDIGMLELTLTSTSGTIDVTSLKTDRAGTSSDSDIAAGSVKLYRDSTPKDGVFQTSDTLLGSGSFSGGTLTFTLSSNNQVAAGTPETWFVALNVSGSAASGVTAGVRLENSSYVTVDSGSVVPDNFPLASKLTAIGNTLVLTGTDAAAERANVTKGQMGILMESIVASVGAGSLTLDSLRVDRTGTSLDADTSASGVRLYRDANANGTYDGADVQLSTSKTFAGGTVTFGSIGQAVSSGSPVRLLIVIDVASGATQGRTIGVNVADSSFVSVTPSAGLTILLSPTPIQSTNLTIVNAAVLTASFVQPAGALSVNTNQPFTAIMRVSNASNSSSANATAPDPTDFTRVVVSGSPTVTKTAGPSPASATIAGGSYQDFTYTYRADTSGTLKLQGGASGTDANLGTPVSDGTVQTPDITIGVQVNPIWEFSDSGAAQAFNAPGIPEPDCPVSGPVSTVFIGNQNGKLYAIRSGTGAKRWGYSVGAAIASPPWVDYENCVVFVGDTAGKLHAVQDNGTSGSLAWSVTLGGSISGAPILEDFPLDAVTYEKRLYVGSSNGNVYCRKAADGTTCTDWTDRAMGAAVSATVSTTPDLALWVPTEGGAIKKLDMRTGATLVNFTGYGKMTSPPFTFPQDIYNYSAGLYMFIGDWNGKFYRIDSWKTPGSEKTWQFSPSSPVSAQAFDSQGWFNFGFEVGGNLALYVSNANGCLYSVNYLTGTQRWRYPTGPNCLANPIRTSPIYYNNVVYFGDDGGNFYALTDGTTQPVTVTGWPYSTTDGFTAASGIDVNANLIVVGNKNSKVYGFPLQ